jgi:hypothetical protein
VTHVTLRGLTFRYAAAFAQRGMVRTGDGWRVERCVFAESNGVGLVVRGKGVVLDRVVAEDNGQMGLGVVGEDIVLQGCVLRRNNWKGYSPVNEAGGAKLARTRGVRVYDLDSYENVGPGLWFDWSNTDFEVLNSRLHDNRARSEDWEGPGLFIEASQGPGRVEANAIYGNAGAGIVVAESQAITIERNLIADNAWGIALRAMEGREEHRLSGVTIRMNAFRGWRQVAVRTGLGKWSRDTKRGVRLEENLYDGEGPLLSWGDRRFLTLDEIRRELGFEQAGAAVELPEGRPR